MGLLCFGLWLLFDANQLYRNALSSPFGTRRSVALAILRPIASVTNALGFSVGVNTANSLLHRNPQPTRLPPPPAIPAYGGGRAPNDASTFALVPRPHSTGRRAVEAVGHQRSVWPPPLGQPTVTHPLVMLSIGDSIGEDLGYGLGDLFSGDRFVHLVQKAKIDTGLARPDYYNWPSALEQDIRQFHPGAVVVMMGANDDQALVRANGNSVASGSPQWSRIYRQRIRLMMDEITASGAHALWVGLPPLQGASASSAFARVVNRLILQAARGMSGVSVVPSWSILAGPRGQFVQYKSIDGSVQQIRYGDGVHLAPAGWNLLASALLRPMQQAWRISLHTRPIVRVG